MFLDIPKEKCIKTLLVQGKDGLVALCLRGDHQLNEVKAEKLPELDGQCILAEESTITNQAQSSIGYIGPVNLPASIPIIVDQSAASLADFVCGANQKDAHYTGANWQRDAHITRVADIREVVAGDPSPDGQGHLQMARGIEVGHIFQLGDKYAQSMDFSVLDETGKATTPVMGCYGIGVTRIAAAAIEQGHDSNGIIWPRAIAPWEIVICPIGANKNSEVADKAKQLYAQLQQAGYDVALDDRGLRPGAMFADIDLIGIPHRIVLGERSIKEDKYEYHHRQQDGNEMLSYDALLEKLA